MATCFSNHSGADDGVLQTKDLSSVVIIKSPFRTAVMNKWIISEVATRSRMSVCAVMPAPTSETGSDEASDWRTDGVLIICSRQELTGDKLQELFGEGSLTSLSSSNLQGNYMSGNPMIYEPVDIGRLYDVAESLGLGMRGKTNLYSDAPPIIIGGTGMMRGKTNLYSDAPPIIIGGTGMMRGKTNLYSDAPPIITGHKTSSKFSVDHEILLDSSFEYDGDSVLTDEMAKSTEWVKPISYLPIGADPMVGPQGLNPQQLFAGDVITPSSNQGFGISEPGVSSRIHATPDQHCIDIPAAKQDFYAMISDAGGRRAALMACVGEQAVAGIVANQIAAAGSNALALYFMVLAIMFGLTFKLAAVALKGNTRCPNLSIWVGKIGDMLTASAIILSLAVHLPPLTACIAAPLAFGIIALAVAFA